MKRILKVYIFFILMQILCLTHAEAKELLGKKFEDSIQINQTPFVLKGIGLKTYLKVKVFVAGFYVGEQFQKDNPQGNIPKRLEIAYFYPVPARKLAVETRRRIQLNTTAEEYNAIKKRVDKMDRYFVNLKPGDRYALTYIPEVGTTFSYNGNAVGVIEGADFAKALFAVWIGEKPISQELKNIFLK
jgi:hypothetical protein